MCDQGQTGALLGTGNHHGAMVILEGPCAAEQEVAPDVGQPGHDPAAMPAQSRKRRMDQAEDDTVPDIETCFLVTPARLVSEAPEAPGMLASIYEDGYPIELMQRCRAEMVKAQSAITSLHTTLAYASGRNRKDRLCGNMMHLPFMLEKTAKFARAIVL